MNQTHHLFWPLQPIASLAAGLLTALSLSLVASPHAQAAAVTYTFDGVVDWDEAERGWTTFSGSFSFDSQASDGVPDGSTAAYAHAGAPWGMSVSFDGGAHTVSYQHAFNILVTNNLGGSDQFGALAQNASGTQNLQLTLWDFTAQLFGSDALPLPDGGLSLADFGWSTFSYESPAGYLQGRLTSFGCAAGCEGVSAPVPEPGSWALLLAGLAAMGGLQQRRRTQGAASR